MFSKPSNRQIDIGLTVIRVITGVIFIAHGSQKIFEIGFDGVAGGFAQMGIPMAAVLGPFVALLEFFGGFALIAGFLTRLVALGLSGTMVVAIFTVHLANGLLGQGGFELPLSVLGSTMFLVIAGAGSLSVDNFVGKLIDRRKVAKVDVPDDVKLRRVA